MTFRYCVYELVIETPFPCPLLPVAPIDAEPEISVVEGAVPYSLDYSVAGESSWDASPGRFLLRGGDRAGRFLVEEGKRIIFHRNQNAEPERLAVCFFVSVLTALLQQRGLLVLHANTALIEQGAVAVCGESGAGKTTTIAGVLAQGNRLLADDITVLRLNKNSRLEVLPGIPHLHLCADTAAQFGYDISAVPRYPWRRMKAALPVPNLMTEQPSELYAIYYLKHTDSAVVSVRQLSGMEKFNMLQECIYGPLLPESPGKMFHVFSQIMAQTKVFKIERPANEWTLDRIVEVVLNG